MDRLKLVEMIVDIILLMIYLTKLEIYGHIARIVFDYSFFVL